MSQNSATVAPYPQHNSAAMALRLLVIGLTAFLTVVDLFATQAILPALVQAYGVSTAAMGFAVNASTIGMAISGLAVGLLGRRIDRRLGILLSMALLSIPTVLLATMPSLPVFTALRVAQGLCMAAAFALTLAHLAEHCGPEETVSAFAAYITGKVASNLFGRLLSAAVADHLGLASNFYVFAALNIAGAILVYVTIRRTPPRNGGEQGIGAMSAAWRVHLQSAPLRAAFGIGFCVLFAFIGTFTYVNFVLVRAPFGLGMMSLGLVYFVFLPSIVSTPLAGRAALRFGVRAACWGGLGVAFAGLPLLLLPFLPAVLTGMVLIGVGTFFAQACATSFVGRAATADRAAAGGLYLACYFLGGLTGTAVLGQAYDRVGWPACVAGIALALGLAMLLTFRLRLPDAR